MRRRSPDHLIVRLSSPGFGFAPRVSLLGLDICLPGFWIGSAASGGRTTDRLDSNLCCSAQLPRCAPANAVRSSGYMFASPSASLSVSLIWIRFTGFLVSDFCGAVTMPVTAAVDPSSTHRPAPCILASDNLLSGLCIGFAALDAESYPSLPKSCREAQPALFVLSRSPRVPFGPLGTICRHSLRHFQSRLVSVLFSLCRFRRQYRLVSFHIASHRFVSSPSHRSNALSGTVVPQHEGFDPRIAFGLCFGPSASFACGAVSFFFGPPRMVLCFNVALDTLLLLTPWFCCFGVCILSFRARSRAAVRSPLLVRAVVLANSALRPARYSLPTYLATLPGTLCFLIWFRLPAFAGSSFSLRTVSSRRRPFIAHVDFLILSRPNPDVSTCGLPFGRCFGSFVSQRGFPPRFSDFLSVGIFVDLSPRPVPRSRHLFRFPFCGSGLWLASFAARLPAAFFGL